MKPKSLCFIQNLILSDPQLCQNGMVSCNKSILLLLPTTCFFHKEVTSKEFHHTNIGGNPSNTLRMAEAPNPLIVLAEKKTNGGKNTS